MQYEIATTPIHASLVGFGDAYVEGNIPATGMRLMNAMYAELKRLGLKNKGINHWVYLPNHRMFTGVELAVPTTDLGSLETLDVSLPRQIRYLHQGPYDQLPAAWKNLTAQLEAEGTKWRTPALEVYGHWYEDPSKLETTILLAIN